MAEIDLAASEIPRLGRRGLGVAVFGLVACLWSGAMLSAQDAEGALPTPTPAVAVAPADDLIELPEYVVTSDALELEEGVEESRMWSVEAERGSIFADLLQEQMASREEFGGLDDMVGELGELEPPNLGTGSGARAPRGFTTPRLRNGFTQQGFPEIVTSGKREVISGMLATFFGRTAPGGIVNILSFRPSPRAQHRIELNVTTQPRGLVRVNATGNLVKKRLDFRVQAESAGRTGPTDYARDTGATGSMTLRWRKGPWVIIGDFEGSGRGGVPGNGIPQARESLTAPVAGPYLPLAGLNLNGPHTFFARRSVSTSLTVDRKLGEQWILRTGSQYWTREMEEHRFRTGQYLLDELVFSGVREPQWTETEETAAAQALELIGLLGEDGRKHRFVAGVEGSRSERARGQFLLPVSARNALPEAVRRFDPTNPDYSLVPYDPAVYTRVISDREERTNYVGAYVSDRISFGRGRHHATAGVRWDRVDTRVADLRPTAPVPLAERTADRTTYHAGVLSEVVKGQLAVFLNYSTAFQPTERVDIRTGEIQGNESTAGVEAGFRAQTRDKRWAATLGVYRLWNRDITRNNPLFEDPVADPNGTQPQLLSAGEERFTGAEMTARWIPADGLSVTGRVVWTDAQTTASPDLPQEVGRQLAGVPEWFGGLTLRQTWELGERRSLGWRLQTNFVGDHVARYESAARLRIQYPSFSTFDLGMDYGWGKARRQRVAMYLRNLADRDLATATGRLDGDRRLEGTWSVVF